MSDALDTPRRFTRRKWLRKWQETITFSRLMQPDDLPGRRRTRLLALGPVRRPVFVLGSPRSGTTYLGTLLSAIPGASYYFEPPILKYYARLIYEGEVPTRRARLLYSSVFRVLRLVAPGRGLRVIEKNPNHTWIAETLATFFPDARFVMIVRNGRDTALSLLEKPWHRRDSAGSGRFEPGGYPYGPYPHFYIERNRRQEYSAADDITRCAWVWRRHTEELLRLQESLPPGTWHVLRYEELLKNPDRTLHELLSFLEADTPESRIAVNEVAASGHRDSIGRWRKQLTAADVEQVDREAGSLLRRLGYE
jgi:hypothetical protein